MADDALLKVAVAANIERTAKRCTTIWDAVKSIELIDYQEELPSALMMNTIPQVPPCV